jgi:predicted nucleic acid-binding protein
VKVLLDVNVLFDFLSDREPFADDATLILSAIERTRLQGFVAAHTITTLYFLLQRAAGRRKARKAISDLLTLLDVVAVDHQRLLQALAMNWKDFEDAVQAACAVAVEVDYLVTRNEADFRRASVEVVSPAELVAVLSAPE